MPTISTDFSQSALAAAVEANMADQFAYFGRSPLATIERTPELLMYRSGIPIPEYNGVMCARFGTEPDSQGLAPRVRSVVASFEALGQPFLWWLGPTSAPTDLGACLAGSGLTLDGEAPGMAADLSAMAAADEHLATPADLSIVAVRDERTLRDWVDVAGAGYGEPEEIRQARYDVHTALGLGPDLPLKRYVAYLGSRPVGMSALFLGSGVAGIYEVATAKDVRRQGIGAAMTREPLLDALELGYRIGTLMASEMGAGVYTRLGFRQVCTFSIFSWEPNA
jgi:GNAT superfamily N-acetyltransferase